MIGDATIVAMTTSYERFSALHAADELFLLPNPWDVGSARLLQALGFVAVATTSSGHAAALGKHDQHVTRSELLDHVASIVTAVDIPLNVDAERCFATTAEGVAETVSLIAQTGAAGLSIEDFDPAADTIDPLGAAVERCAAAAEAAHHPDHPMVLTARTENKLHGVDDIDDTIERLCAFRDAGADAVYAPGLTDLGEIRRIVAEVGVPVNVLLFPGGPTPVELAEAGVRRASTGGALAFAAYGAMAREARALLAGDVTYWSRQLSRSDRDAAFGDG
jgi:2-methylisocitrate lyase-like PEP mutase family enzyme